jgi:hypothetical protein
VSEDQIEIRSGTGGRVCWTVVRMTLFVRPSYRMDVGCLDAMLGVEHGMLENSFQAISGPPLFGLCHGSGLVQTQPTLMGRTKSTRLHAIYIKFSYMIF